MTHSKCDATQKMHIERRVYTSRLRICFEMHCFFLVPTLIELTKVITRETQRNAENACVTGMWQLGLSGCENTPLKKMIKIVLKQF